MPHYESHLLWLRDIWTAILGPRPGRRWEIATLVDGDIFLRDGFAYSLIFHRLGDRRDVGWRYVRAYMFQQGQAPLQPGDDLLFIGRTKPFGGTALADYVRVLETEAAGKFLDFESGEPANTIQYRDRRYTRRLRTEPPFGRYRRCDLDYALFMLRRHGEGANERTIMSFGGIGSFGTLIMLLILNDDVLRDQLIAQINQLVRWTIHHHPEKQFEVCIRVEVPGPERLARFLHEASRHNHRIFEFQVEVVAVGTEENEPELFFHEREHVDLELRVEGDGSTGGSVTAVGKGQPVKMAPMRFAVLLAVVEDPQNATPAGLCRRLGLMPKDKNHDKGVERQHNNLARVIHDLNADLRSDSLLGPQFTRPIHFSKRERRYVLEGIRAKVYRPPVATPSEVLPAV